uniref:Uncharacterized protein n=1 Tax=Oryza punctata TaxID=4537 RepID=A0A0E0L9W0_ORYPU
MGTEKIAAIVQASQPTVEAQKNVDELQDSDNDEPDEDDAYSSPSDPCPSPKGRKKEADGGEVDEDYVPLKKVACFAN